MKRNNDTGFMIFPPMDGGDGQRGQAFLDFLNAMSSNAEYSIAGVPLHPGRFFTGNESVAKQRIEKFCSENSVTYKHLDMNYGELTINGTVHGINPYGIDFEMMFEFMAKAGAALNQETEEGKVEPIQEGVNVQDDLELVGIDALPPLDLD